MAARIPAWRRLIKDTRKVQFGLGSPDLGALVLIITRHSPDYLVRYLLQLLLRTLHGLQSKYSTCRSHGIIEDSSPTGRHTSLHEEQSSHMRARSAHLLFASTPVVRFVSSQGDPGDLQYHASMR